MYDNQEQQQSIFDDGALEVQERTSILKLANYTRIFSFLTLASGIIGLLSYFRNMNRPAPVVADGYAAAFISGQANLLTVIISLLLSAVNFYFLYKFSQISKSAVEKLKQEELSISFNFLATYFKITGFIIMLVLMAFVLIMLFFGLGRLVA
jgi:hypothetical protein